MLSENIINECSKDLVLFSLKQYQSKFVLIFVWLHISIEVSQVKAMFMCCVYKFRNSHFHVIWQESPYLREFLVCDYSWIQWTIWNIVVKICLYISRQTCLWVYKCLICSSVVIIVTSLKWVLKSNLRKYL